MSERPEPQHLFERYLRILGLRRERPGRAALGDLTAAQLVRIPFENISKLHQRKHTSLRGLPGLESYLDGIARNHFGGTCYANNYYFYLLLRWLDYDVRLCGADMSEPDVHLVSMVVLEGREFLIDAGYAAPFLEPLPRDLPHEVVVESGNDRYVLRPRDDKGRSRMEQYRDGVLNHGYTMKPGPRKIEDFDAVIEDSYSDHASFMNAVHLVRFFPGRSVAIRNDALIESRDTESRKRRLESPDQIAEAIVTHFFIPRCIVEEAISSLGPLRDPCSHKDGYPR